MPVHVKICGITCPEDAVAAFEAGADAVGLVFAPSPRQVDLVRAAAVRASLPGAFDVAGVFVGEPFPEVRRACEAARLSTIQMHRRPEDIWPAADVTAFHAWLTEEGLRYVLAVRARDAATLDAELDRGLGRADQLLLDAYAAGSEGGTGRVYDWSLTGLATRRGVPVIVAGGLTPRNVAEAIRQTRPWGVDVSTGVERAPGRKDSDAVRAFVLAVRQTDLTAE
jgi:phosphoribosylanthranilate isomerase